MGIEIVRRAIQAPARHIAENAGEEGSVIVGKLLEGKDDNVGFDAKTGEFSDMIKAGVIDPTKVARCFAECSVCRRLACHYRAMRSRKA